MAEDLVLMERGFDSMNVPGEKVTEYLAAGWKEISRKPVTGNAKPSAKVDTKKPVANPTPVTPKVKA